MIRAIRHNDLNLVKQLYSPQLCAQWKHDSSLTLLSVACKSGNALIVAWLVETAKLDVDERNKSGNPALFCCANADVMQVLLRNGANVHACTQRGLNALTWTGCYDDDQVCAKLLFDAGLELQDGHPTPPWLHDMNVQVQTMRCCKRAVLFVLVAKRTGNFPRVPYDVMKLIARHVWDSRTDVELWERARVV